MSVPDFTVWDRPGPLTVVLWPSSVGSAYLDLFTSVSNGSSVLYTLL